MRLSAEQLNALSKLLDAGLDLDGAEREVWLEGLVEPFPGANQALRDMFAAEASGQAEEFFDTLPGIAAVDAPAPDGDGPAFQPGSLVRNYRLVREIGHGGMSTVWLAMRTDELARRPVALKLPYMHLQRALFASRFTRERDILANLTHPHIAHLYDAGISPEGQPYLALEFVAGESIVQYCRTRGVNVAEQVDLFLQVLSAVHHAHTQNIIHRDLKPSNILVREGGHVALLDFGIAKLLIDGEASETELTRHGGVALTPDYASPEQIRGDPLGPATDIYSLGVVLYELLTGQRPYELKRTTRRELEEAILSTDPRRPSDAVTGGTHSEAPYSSSQSLRKSLRGDLDSIVLKAMKKHPKDRYTTADAFAEDLRRYRRHDAVSAQPDTLWYRAGRLAQRYRSPLVTAAAAITVTGAAAWLAENSGWIRHSVAPPTVASPRAAEPGFAPPAHSIAVLPFVDMSQRHNQEYLADGLADDVINTLSKIPDIRVAGRTSSFRFRSPTDPRMVGRELGVAYLVDGSVRRFGGRVRVTATLTDVRSGAKRWSETYDRDITNVLALQTEIAINLVRGLQLSVAPSLMSQWGTETRNSEAYDLYLRGQHAVYRFDQAGFEAASAYAQRALDLDPAFVPAAELLAASLFDLAEDAYVPAESGFERARSAAQAVLRLDQSSGMGHAILAAILCQRDWNWTAAEHEFGLAEKLAPRNPFVLIEFAWERVAVGDWDKALRLLNASIASDPLDAATYTALRDVYLHLGRLADAEQAARRGLEINPYGASHTGLATVLLAAGKPDAALVEARVDAKQGATPVLVAILDARHQQREADAALAHLETQHPALASLAGAYAYRAQISKALDLLEQAYARHETQLTWIKNDVLLASLTREPRFEALLSKMNLPH